MQPTQANRAGTDQRAAIAETGGRDPDAAHEAEPAVFAEAVLGGVEERRPESERDGTADHDEIEVERVAHRRHRAPRRVGRCGP